MVVPRKTILVLIGPKGAGKSYLGNLIERELGVGFLDVEALFRAMPDAADVRAGYDASLHLPASEGMIKKVHDMSTNLELDFDAAIENVDLSDATLVGRVREVLRNKEDVR